MRITITTDATDARAFLVHIEGEIRRPRELHAALGRRLARELQGHFREKNRLPNKMAAPKTNFWKKVSDATTVTTVTEREAIVTIAEQRFRLHLYGGTIRPTGGRKALTIPLVKEARGRRVAEYERATGRKLFTLPGVRLLFERTGSGDRSLAVGTQAGIRGRSGSRKISLAAGMRLRPVYALARSVKMQADPRALPPPAKLASALQDAADTWLARSIATPPTS